MKHPLQQRLHRLRYRVRRLLAIHGLSCVLATLLGALLLVGLADWASHRLRLGFFDDTGVRLIFGLAILGLIGWTLWRFLWRPLSVRLGDLELSLRVEQRFPQLEDRLASTVEFLGQPDEDPSAGSAALRRAVITQSSEQLRQLDVDDVVQTRQTRRAALTAVAVSLATVGIVLLNPSGAALALARLANPFADNPWPKQTHLDLVAYPQRVAVGDPFEVIVGVQRGKLPSQGDIEYRAQGRPDVREPLRRVGDVFKAGRETVQVSFQFRVRAGDDQTPWESVQVVPPPKLEALQLRLTYPEYTRKQPEDLPEGVGHVRALRGTKVHLRAAANKPLSAAGLRFTADENVVASVDPSSPRLEAAFNVRKNNTYWIHLVDREPEAFTNARQAAHFDVRSIDDLAPDVFFETPSSHQQVKSDAIIPLRVVAKDDIGLAAIDVHYARTDRPDEDPVVMPLYRRPDRPLQQSVDHHWDLAPLGLGEGTVVTIQAHAADYDDLDGPNVGRSHEIRLEIVSTQQVMRRIEELQARLQQELEGLLKTQRLSNSQVKGLQLQIEHTGRLDKPDIDNLQGAEMAQRHVTGGLTNPADGVRGMIDRILQDLANNRIDDPETTERLQGMAETIEQLQRSPLPAIEQQLNLARKGALNALAESPSPTAPSGSPGTTAQQPTSKEQQAPRQPEPDATQDQQQQPSTTEQAAETQPDATPKAALAQAQSRQQEVIAAMQGMLDQLAKWEHYRVVSRDVNELIRDQQQLEKETADVAKQTLGKKPQDLTDQQRADLQRAAEAQRGLADRFGRVVRKMEQFQKQLESADPQVAENFADALQQAEDSAVSPSMRQADRDLQNNRVAQAQQQQQQSRQGLRDVLDILENRRENQLLKLVRELKQAEKELQQLRREQAAHLERTQQATQQQNQAKRREQLQRLAQRQAELQQQAQRFGRKLRRLQARQAGQSTQQAASNMGQAQQGMQQDQANQAQQEQQQALDQLQRAQQQLAQARRRAEEQLAMEQLAKIGDQLAQMIKQQNGLIDRTKQLDRLRAERGTFSRSQRRTLRQTAQTQTGLQKETDDLVERLTAAPVFALALRGASRNMQRAAALLDQFQADAPTQQAQQNAARRITQLLDALKPESGDGRQQQQGGGGGGSGGRPRDGIPPMAQIKMLKSLQLEINQRTKEIHTLREQSEGRQLAPDQEAEFRALSQEQGILAEIVADLIQPAGPEQEQN